MAVYETMVKRFPKALPLKLDLTETTLTVTEGDTRRDVSLSAIRHIALRPQHNGIYACQIGYDGGRVEFASKYFEGFKAIDTAARYRGFVLELHERIAKLEGPIKFETGNRALFAGLVVACVLLAALLIATFIAPDPRSALKARWMCSGFLGVAVSTAIVMRPGTYDPMNIPEKYLPPA